MPKTARDLIIQAAKTAGVIEAIETLESEEASHALDELNNILETWNLDALFPYVNREFNVPVPTITAGQIIMGPTTGSVDVETPRPNRVVSVAILLDNRYVPLESISSDTMATSNIRNIDTALPLYYSVETGYPDITITVHPGSNSYAYFITTQDVVTAKTLNDEIDLPMGYYPALQYELASVLAAVYGNMEMVPQLEKMATQRLARIKRLNNQPRLLSHEGTPIGAGYWDIYTDTYN